MKKGKGVIIWLLKCFVAGIVAVAILSVFSLFYYNHGIRKTSETGATDYSWENQFHSVGYEGFAWGINDANGYNNAYTLDKEDIDILLMGSSHMNAYNVPQKCSVSYLLNYLMQTSGMGYGVYNIGMEGHTFFMCSDNLEDALEAYSPQKYVIMETRSVKLSIESMEEVLTGTRKRTPAFDSGLIYYMQKVPYFCLLHRQIRDMCDLNDASLAENDNDTATKADNSNSGDTLVNIDSVYNTQLNRYMEKLAKEASGYKVKLLVFYMPNICINDDGTVGTVGNPQDIAEFASACRNYGIEFLDMSGIFLENYRQNYELPFGFSNTEAGKGHLNRRGHELVANALFDKIMEIEGK
ncbi:MAG: hypothetical protein HFH74_10485 [Lachnospiraceae bacterium]|jgi:hypothetical protein|nr:hypothetical protein [Lachnospiraceae bacterium]